MGTVKKHCEITHAEWICYDWVDITGMSDPEPLYLRKAPRPLDEAMRLSGGSIKTLEPYLWALLDENLLEARNKLNCAKVEWEERLQSRKPQVR